MLKDLHSKEKKILRQIAKFYGCKVKFDNTINGGQHQGMTILVGTKGNFHDVMSTFFHELQHFINMKTNKYELYHNPKYFGNLRKKFKSKQQMLNYALKAEIYTDKMGAKLAKEWFPSIKYVFSYRNNEWYKGFLYGYYFMYED